MNFDGSRVLDVGFGRGEFLLLAKSLGASAEGVELDPAAVALARSLGFVAHQGEVADLNPEDPFDLVTFLDVVEHPLRPVEMLERAIRSLADGGLLVIWTPNGDAACPESHYVTFRVDLEHMQYFTADTCGFLARRLGLKIVHLEMLGFPALSDIDRPLEARGGMAQMIKQRLGRAPAYRSAWDWKERMLRAVRVKPDDRTGTYHLFCIMQKG